LRRQHINLAQFGDDLLGLMYLPSHPWSSSGQKPYSEYQFNGGGSVHAIEAGGRAQIFGLALFRLEC
jgi:hypothetical protein